MMIVMKEGATEDQISHVVERIEEVGCSAHLSKGELLTVIGAIGDRDRVAALGLEGDAGVDHLVPILKPYKLASAQFSKGERSVLEIDGRKVGGDHFAPDRRPVHGREPRADARGRADRRRRRARRCCAAAPTSRGPRRTASRASGVEGLRLLAGGQGGDRPADRHRADGRARRRRRRRGRRRDPDRRPQHAELHACSPRSAGPACRSCSSAASRPTLDELLMASEYVLKEGNERDALRARHPDVRDRLPVHPRPAGDPGAQGAHAPAGDRRSRATRRAAATGSSRCRWPPPRPVPTGSSSRSTTDPEHAICDGPAGAADRRRSPTTPSRSGASPRSPASKYRSSERLSPRVAVLGVGLIGGSIGLAARGRLGAEVIGYDRDPAHLGRGGRAGRARSRRRIGRRGGRRRRRGLLRGAGQGAARASSPRRCAAAGADAVVTDVGSTKRALRRRARRRRRGPTASSAAIRSPARRPPGSRTPGPSCFEGARWYLTPTAASSGLAYDRAAARRRRPRRPPAGDRRRDPRPGDGDRQPPAARARQRARRAGRGGARRGGRAAARGRAELSRHDPGRRRQPGDLGRHLRHQPRRASSPRSRRCVERLARGRRG